MIRGIRASVSAMKAQLARQEVLSRNLVNFSMPGYKQESASISGFSATIGRMGEDAGRRGVMPLSAMPQVGSMGTEIKLDRVSVDFRQGELQQTDRALDVALIGDGFLRVRTPEGEFFSRGGSLHLVAGGRVVTSDGHAVLGSEGEVVLGSGRVSIEDDGTLTVDGVPTTRLSVVEFEPGTRLAKVSERVYAPDDPLAAEPVDASNTVVKGGFLESSNVEHVPMLVELTSLLRAYQANQRMIQAQDELLAKAVNEVGRV